MAGRLFLDVTRLCGLRGARIIGHDLAFRLGDAYPLGWDTLRRSSFSSRLGCGIDNLWQARAVGRRMRRGLHDLW